MANGHAYIRLVKSKFNQSLVNSKIIVMLVISLLSYHSLRKYPFVDEIGIGKTFRSHTNGRL